MGKRGECVCISYAQAERRTIIIACYNVLVIIVCANRDLSTSCMNLLLLITEIERTKQEREIEEEEEQEI